jgi:hypothetical protein
MGILLYELLAEKTPFDNIDMDNMKEMKFKGIKFSNETFNTSEISLISSLTKTNPGERLGARNSMDIFRHPFF